MIEKVIMVNPEDVNLADVKAVAAERNASVIGNPCCPHGQMIIVDASVLRLWQDD